MTATLNEVLSERRNQAAIRAIHAADALRDGKSNDVVAQADLEVALSDFRNYDSLYRDLRPVVSDLGVYRRDGSASLLNDLRVAKLDNVAAGRVQAHNRSEQRAGDGLLERQHVERRDLGTFAVIPQWAVADAAPRSIAASPTMNMLARPMPPGSLGGVNIVSLPTAPVAAMQSALNAAIQENDPVTGSVSAAMNTHALRIDVSLQLLEQGKKAIDATLLPAIVEAVDSSIGSSFLASLTSLSGATQATYTDATPTLAEFWAALEPLIRSVQTSRKVGGRPLVVVHPRRLSWLRQKVIAENIAGLDLAEPVTAGATVSVMGSIDVVADPTVTVANGAGTNEDVVYVLPSADVVDLFLSPPTVTVAEAGASSLSSSLTATVIGRRYVAVASRAAAAVGVLTGTGLTTPV